MSANFGLLAMEADDSPALVLRNTPKHIDAAKKYRSLGTSVAILEWNVFMCGNKFD